MGEGVKRHTKAKFSEEDAATLLKRYNATTVLSLLQEVAQVQDEKMDWEELVKKTKTGITNAREYQMLWRHLAYRHALTERLDNKAESAKCLDDDSDIESEVAPLPSVNSELSTEAAAYVKVLIASGAQRDSSIGNGSMVEAPLLINIPSCQSTGAAKGSKLQWKNIKVPVWVQKMTKTTGASAEGLETNGAAGVCPRKRRKPWSEAEDLELIAAVQKLGEGNWENILKGDIKGERTPTQLSRRWQIIRKKNLPMSIGSTPQVSEAMLAARRAVNMAIDMPDTMPMVRPNVISGKMLVPSTATRPAADTPSAPPAYQSMPDYSAPSKPRAGGKKLPAKPLMTADDMVKAAAVAAGARIASPSDARTLLKAAQAKNLVHVMPGGGSLNKPPVVSSSLPPNVHFLRDARLPAPPSISRPTTPQVQNNSSKPASHSNRAGPEPHRAAAETKVKASSNMGPCSPPKEQVKEDQSGVAGSVTSKNVVEFGMKDTVPVVGMAPVSGKKIPEVEMGPVSGEQIPEVEMTPVSGEQIQEEASAGLQSGTTGPAQEGQIALPSPAQNEEGQEQKMDRSSQETAAIRNGESVDTVMADAEVVAKEEASAVEKNTPV